MKKGLIYVKKHPMYNATIHAIGGLGVGILIGSSIVGIHPISWGIALIVISLLGHVYAWFA